MNGQHFNSSGSGNGTPTPPSNSSYPASLSSQSSRDPSPHARELGVPSHYGYSTNYDQKSSSHVLVNNFSNVPIDPAKQQQPPGIYGQKSQQQFTNSSSVRLPPQGFMNHNVSSNISSYNTVTSVSSSLYITSGNKYNVMSTQNSSFSTPSTLFTSPQNNYPHQMINRNQFQTNSQPFSAVQKTVASSTDTKVNDVVHSQSSQLPSNPSIASSLPEPSLQNIPPLSSSSSSALTNVNLTNSTSSAFDRMKVERPQAGSNNDNLLSRFSSGSTDNLHSLPPTTSPPLQTAQFVNSSSSASTSPRSSNNLTSTPDLSPSPRVNSSFSSTNSSVHSSQESSSSSSITNHSSSVPAPSSLQPVMSSVQNATSPFSPNSLGTSQNLFPSSSPTPPLSSQPHAGRLSDVNGSNGSSVARTSSPSNQQLSQNQPTDSLTTTAASPLNHTEERHSEETGLGDRSGKPINQESNPIVDQAKPFSKPQQQPVPLSQSQQFQSQFIPPPNQFSASTQSFGQFNQNKHPLSSLSNLNQSQPASVSSNQTVPTSHPQPQSSQFNSFQKYPTPPPSSVSASAVQNKPPGMPPQSNFGQRMPPPPNLTGHPPPLQSGVGQQQPTAASVNNSTPFQSMPPAPSGLYHQKPPSGFGQQMPPVSVGSVQQMPPPGVGLQQQMPPSNLVSNQSMPPTSFGLNQQMPPPQTSARQYPPTQMPADLRKGPQYPQYPPSQQNQFQQRPPLPQQNQFQQRPPLPQQNQFQQRPPLPNQYPQQNAPLQTQPVATGGPYGMSRYPPMPHAHGGAGIDSLTNQLRASNVTQDGFNKLWGIDTYDLLKTRDLLPKERIEAPQIRLNPELFDAANCSPELFRCTLTKIPETKSLLDKSRLPLGVLIHPFKDLTQLSVIQCSTIVRCRACRTYINPFVYFVDNKRWKCNLCFRVNELPDEFQFDPMSKTYGDPSRRPEIKSATIEFIAPSEYMVRPPQPAIYLFLLDVSRLGAESGYLEVVCQTLLEELENLPGDARTSVGFITYDTNVHFYSLTEGLSQPHQMVVVDIDDMFLPCPENLLVNLSECHDLIKDLLTLLPKQYAESYDTESALGAALQAAYKLLAPTGGRITVFQSRLPSVGPGALVAREDPSQRASDTVPHLNPSTDFYKKLALDCSSQQIAVDLFIVNSQYVDVATLSGVSRFSGGCMYHFPLFRAVNSVQVSSLKRTFQRYLTRKIGFESVMRLRCTRGLSIHTFHGNFFVRSTDLLSLPNVNPDAGFGMQVSIDETLSELQNVCFQAALLYTSSKGERRIRVHTLCLPIATNLSDILNAADQQCIIGLLAKMAVDRSIESSLTDAREAFVNVVADILSAYKITQNSGPAGSVLAPNSLRLIPMYILALLKSVAFRTGQSTRLDDRVFAMCQMKTLPLASLLQSIYPDLYPVHNLEQQPQVVDSGDENPSIVPPQRLQLSSEKIDSHGVYLLDNGTMILIYVGHNINPALCQALFGVPHFAALPQDMFDLPELSTPENERLRDFVILLQSEKPFDPCIQIIRDDSHHRGKFLECLVEDKNEAGTSYYEFLQRIKVLMK